MRDQLEVYKKLRQNHQKEVRILETRLQMEMNDHRRSLDREYDQQVHVHRVAVCLYVLFRMSIFLHKLGLIILSNLFCRVSCVQAP